MGFITKYNKKYNFHYTKGFDFIPVEEFTNEAFNIIRHPLFVKNMNAIWDLRFCKLPDKGDKLELIMKFIKSIKEIAPIKGENYKTAILVDNIEKYNDLSNYIILANENKLAFDVNIFMEISEALSWFGINKKYFKTIINDLRNGI